MEPADAIIRYTVSGRVQGVGFRMFVHMHALSMGLRGWVRNLPTGEVETVAHGPRERLAQLKALLWRGPAEADVSDVAAEELDMTVDLPETFQVRR